MKVLVDPYVIAIPPIYSTKDKVLSYLNGIQSWLDTASYPFIMIFQSSDCTNYLIQTDKFPFRNNLNKLFISAGITEYDANTVFAFASRIFHSWKCIEDGLRVVRIHGKWTEIPSLLFDRLPQDLLQPFLLCLTKLWIQQSLSDNVQSDVYIGSVNHDCRIERNITISVNITNIEADNGDLLLVHELTQKVLNYSILFDEEDLLKSIEWDAVWQYPIWAIKKGYYTNIQPSERNTYILGAHKFGDYFLTTITDLGLQTQSGRIRSIYETCALIACGFASPVKGINPRRLQGCTRTADGAQGMRANISKAKAGYRLHYWQCPDGMIEFSRLNVHKNLSIY